MSSRRNFLQQTALGLAGTVAVPYVGKSALAKSFRPVPFAGAQPLNVGVAGYTFVKFNLEQSIAMMKRIGVTNLSLKEFHLPLNSTQETVDATLAKFKDAGINVYAVGVIYMKTKEAVDQAFAYAKKCGVTLIVGAPNYDQLDYAEEKVKEYNIRLAIHNHGPEDKLYPGPQDVMNRIKNRDPRVGLCIDIGHATRAGVTVEKAVKEYKDRLFDMHIKDVSKAEQDGKAIEIGRGVINFPGLIRSLEKIKYSGMCSIEFEKDMSDPLPGMAESIGYFRGVMADSVA